MTKAEFIEAVKPILKNRGYRKKGFYWYKQGEDLLLCVNVQGSSWDKNDYYVEIGIAPQDAAYPTILHWEIRHRCIGTAGERNIQSEELLCELERHHQISKRTELPEYLAVRDARPVVNQFWF